MGGNGRWFKGDRLATVGAALPQNGAVQRTLPDRDVLEHGAVPTGSQATRAVPQLRREEELGWHGAQVGRSGGDLPLQLRAPEQLA